MKPRKLARTTTSVSRMQKLLATGDPRIAAALLENPKLPKKLRKQAGKQISKLQPPAKHELSAKSKKSKSKSAEPGKHEKKRKQVAQTKPAAKPETVKAFPQKAFDPSFDLLPIESESFDSSTAEVHSAGPTGVQPAPPAFQPPAFQPPAFQPPAFQPAESVREPVALADQGDATDSKLCSFQPIAPVFTDRRSKKANSSPAGDATAAVSVQPPVIDRRTAYVPAGSVPADKPAKPKVKPATKPAMATVTSIAPAVSSIAIIAPDGAPTLQDSLNRVLVAFKREAKAAGKLMAPGTPGEIVNAFFWVCRDTSNFGVDKTRYTTDWVLFTAYRCCLARKSGFMRNGEYRVYRKSQVSSVDVNVGSYPEIKDAYKGPSTFVSLKFNFLDGTSIVRHMYIDREDPQKSLTLARIHERLERIKDLGWPLVDDATWDAMPDIETNQVSEHQ